MADENAQLQEQQPKEHPPTDCMCLMCQPEAFAGRRAMPSMPVHLCQKCFTGPCGYPGGELPAEAAE